MNNFIGAFENSVKKAEGWHAVEAPTWKNRLRKIARHPARYFLYQISKKHPVSIVAKTFFATKFCCYLPDYFLMWCYGIVGDPSEIKLTRFLLKTLREGDVLLDVGSSCGFYSVLGSRLVGENGNVHAFEPTPEVYRFLNHNTDGLSNVYAVQAAVSDESGHANFSINPVFAVANSLVISPSDLRHKTISVPTVTLDEYCSSKAIWPTFIKLDVEGAEELVIRGAKRILRDANPVLSLEVLRRNDGVHFDAPRTLVEMGYTPHRILENGATEIVSLESINDELPQGDNAFENFIFKRL